MTKILKNYINGEWVESKSSSFLDVINPAERTASCQVPAGSKDDILRCS